VFSKQDKEVKRKIMFVTSPPKLKQTGFLTFEYLDKEKEDDQWIYLPSMGKHKRIAAADRNDSFMGSDLNYSDLNSKQVDDYRYCILKETTVGKTDVWLIESLPKSVSVIEQTGYLKAILAIQKTNYAILRVMAWSSDGKTVKIQDFSDFICIDKVWIPRDILVASRVGNVTRHTTRLRIDNIRLDPDLPDDLFTVRSLEKGFSR
jgi:outer membrane lipoprotein-sorting protein